ncbi:MAG: hypothetical protein IKS21_03785 [Oscillospiraceae bacterium]|nr:hypothetical protein [Oscillospiraceae bacterium]
MRLRRKKHQRERQNAFDRNALVHCLSDRQIIGQEAVALNDKRNLTALAALEDLLLNAREQLPFASDVESTDYRYVSFLVRARQAALDFHYETACVALLYVVSLEEIREKRVLINLIATLEEIT